MGKQYIDSQDHWEDSVNADYDRRELENKIDDNRVEEQPFEGKKLYYQFSDNADVSKIVMDLSGCVAWIEADMEGVKESDDEREYIITPIWMTDLEFENLPEANF